MIINIHMTKKNLEEQAVALGYRSGDKSDPNRTLADVVESGDLRYWEAFPVLLANAANAGRLDIQAAEDLTPEGDRKYLRILLMVSLALYEALGARFTWRGRLAAGLPARLIAGFRARIEAGRELELGDRRLNSAAMAGNFRAAFKTAMLKGALRAREDDELETALGTIFTARQRELVTKRLRRERFTKTEAEYFSRVVKKKLAALASDELHRLARRALA